MNIKDKRLRKFCFYCQTNMSKKRQCMLTDDLSHEFPFLKKSKVTGNVCCETCNSVFFIGSGGRTDINRHLSTYKHKRALEAAATSSKLNIFLRKADFGVKEQELAHAEVVFTYHTIMHSQSFRSMNCTSKLVRSLFEPKFSCGRTKTEAIAKNVLAPYSVDQTLTSMEYINFITIFSDASNHKDTKLFPSVIRYFNYKRGIQVKLLDFVSLPGETSDMIASSIFEIFCKFEMQNKVAAICTDNANTNFGGLLRKGTNNVYAKLKDRLQKPIIGVGCTAHTVNNAIQNAADQLPVDVEGIFIKIYSHFYIFTVRVEKPERVL
ncbi:uncharacterized protein LOC129717880 isoform X2 [Wyeomyia smithii]|uniref:uncharacterized protein LOC129717880 isoform X2 n=1 Tax=Wyeomyia smithii TaxID=174621 RepID=UPI002467ED42|nr:uncharacterized protein LOC129717880 isoform X2 [Wyeomyia smithii]